LLVSIHNWLFNGAIDASTRTRISPFSSTLVLTGFNVHDALGIDPEKAKSRDFVLGRRGRDLKGAIFDFAILPKVDLTDADLSNASLANAQLQGASLDGARLRGASLAGAQLQGATLDHAQLQGASLVGAQLQGASLTYAQLQGAWLGAAQLQGASLGGAQLQGASLENAQLQGALLDDAQLRGASLVGAQLQGATLNHAQLQGASLPRAQLRGASLDDAQLQGALLFESQLQGASLSGTELQGAFLQGAGVEATDLAGAWLWRTNATALTDIPKPTAVRISNVLWEASSTNLVQRARVWNDEAYQDLRKTIEALPDGTPRNHALANIRRLDCASQDKRLASCDPGAPLPSEAGAWKKALEAASVDDATYAEALAKSLKSLVCAGGDDAIYVVRGVSRSMPLQESRLDAGGTAASDLIDDLMDKDSKDCPVAAALSDADRARLREIRRGITCPFCLP
jgi:uncharacterized protein YjbI with pentapeptide repeats